MKLLDRFLLPFAIALFLGSGAYALHGLLRVRLAAAEKTDASRASAPRIMDVGPVPERKNYPNTELWLQALEEHSAKVEAAIADEASNGEKVLRSSRLIDALATSQDLRDPMHRLRVQGILRFHQVVLKSLTEPEESIRDAWSAFDSHDSDTAIDIGELLVENPSYDCLDTEVVLAYWETSSGRHDSALARLRRIADQDDHPRRDLALYLIAWSHLRRAHLQSARTAFERFVDSTPHSPLRSAADSVLSRLSQVTKPSGPSPSTQE